ncbi:MAG: PAS domain S-box protein [Dissulfurispiraceae bacterium]
MLRRHILASYRASSLTIGLGAFLIIAIIAVAVTSAVMLRYSEVDVWKKQAGNLSMVLAEHTSQTMFGAYEILDRISEKIQSMSIRNASELRSKMRSAEVFEMLNEISQGLSQIDVATIVDNNGDVITFTRSYPAPEINLADRDYFKSHVANPNLGNYISMPVRNKGNGKWTFYISRRLNSPDGRMIGLVLVGISVDTFSALYEKIGRNLGEGASISLFRRDFVLLTRWPKVDNMIGQSGRSGIAYQVVEVQHKTADAVYTDSPRSIDGASVARIVAPRTVERYPLIVSTSVTEDMFLAGWRNTTWAIAVVATGCIFALTGVLIFFVRIQRMREADADRNLKLNAALLESESRFRDLFENVSDLIQSVRPDGRLLYVNRSWRETLCYSEEDISRLSVFDIIHPDCMEHCLDVFQRLMSGESVNNVEAIFVAKGGQQVVLEGTASCKFENGKPVATLGMFRDITQRKHIEEQLNKISHHNKLILNSTGEGILGVDLEGNHTFVNPEAARMLGYTAEELLGRHSHSIWHHTKTDGTPYLEEDCPIYAAIKTGVVYHRVRDELFWRKDSSFFPVSYTSTPIIDDGCIVGAVLTFTDISVQKQAEDALHESESRLRTILEAVQAGIILIDAETHAIVDVNSVAANLIGKPKESIIGSICHNYICPAEVGKCPITDLAQVVDNSERVLITSDGTRIQVIKTVVPIMLNGHRHILESFVDISEQKKLEKQLLQSQKMDAIGQLAGGVAHDFNNILSAIIGSAHLALMKITEDNTARQDISQVLESAQRATVLTQSLLAFGRKQAIELQVCDMNEIISGFEKFLMRIIREDVNLRTVLTKDKLPIMADRGQIEQVIMNMATNARDAMPRGGELLIKTGRISIDEQFLKLHGYGRLDEYACITVSDNGAGMNEATKRKIFEPFFTTKEVGKGTGLGLAVAYGIVKKHNGYINVVSEEGKGSSFNIYLPISTVPSEIMEDKPLVQTPARGGSETILIAEDDAALRKLMTTVLSHHGYTVIMATDGEEAVASFANDSACIDLVMLDGIMPRKNGKEAYKEMIRIRPDIKGVFISGYAEDIFTGEDFTAANIAFIHKPVSPQDLLRKVRKFLDGL